tara:strand:- start:2435 stop:2641 length:207 start_codon:yes stop_codon:yes gene_type:complete
MSPRKTKILFATEKKGEKDKLWDQLREIPVNNHDELEKSFLHFEAGVSKFEVWKWFESEFEVCLGDED